MNGTIPLSGSNLTHPTSAGEFILRDIKGAIKQVAKSGLEAAFDSYYDEYAQFRNLKIRTERPISNTDFPCVVVGIQGLRVKQIGLDRRSRNFVVQVPGGYRAIREEKRFFEGRLALYHASYTSGELGYLSDALIDVISFDPGNKLINYVMNNDPGMIFMSDVLDFQGEQEEPAPEGGDRGIYSDVLTFPFYGEVVMRAVYAIVTDIQMAYAILSGDGETVVQPYPPGWDW